MSRLILFPRPSELICLYGFQMSASESPDWRLDDEPEAPAPFATWVMEEEQAGEPRASMGETQTSHRKLII